MYKLPIDALQSGKVGLREVQKRVAKMIKPLLDPEKLPLTYNCQRLVCINVSKSILSKLVLKAKMPTETNFKFVWTNLAMLPY